MELDNFKKKTTLFFYIHIFLKSNLDARNCCSKSLIQIYISLTYALNSMELNNIFHTRFSKANLDVRCKIFALFCCGIYLFILTHILISHDFKLCNSVCFS